MKEKKRRWDTHPVLANRPSTEQFYVMFEKHRMYPDKFFQYYRMSVTSFDELLCLLNEEIRKNYTAMKKSIPPEVPASSMYERRVRTAVKCTV